VKNKTFFRSGISRALVMASACVFSGAAAMAQYAGPPPQAPVGTGVDSLSAKPNISAVDAANMLPVAPIRILPGDQLTITFPNMQFTVAADARPTSADLHLLVDAKGDVQMPWVGPIHVGGLTVVEASAAINAKLRDEGYIKDADVVLQLTEAPSHLISISGDVKTPTVLPAFGERRLLDVIAAAGGLMPDASHMITIVRPGVPQPIRVLLDPNPQAAIESNIPLYAGDAVLVPRAGSVYVVGAVKTQNAFPITTSTPLTLMQAISMAGGANFEAALSKVRIVRTEGNARHEIPVDLKKVLNGKTPDPILQADDVVYVPGNLFKGGIKGGGVGIATGLIFGLTNTF
jgi:polysaccharide export outer membrane protein